MFRLLKQPYPVEESAPRIWLRAVLIGAFIGLFLLAFQPFGMHMWQTPHKPLKLLGFGGITFVLTAFNFLVWPRLFPKLFAEARWTVGREILHIMGNILLIALANWYYLDWLMQTENASSGMDWLGMILVTFLIGIFPTTGVVFYNYVRQLAKYTELARQLPVHEPGSSTLPAVATSAPEAPLTLLADNEKDTLTLMPTHLLYIESSDNYCTVVYRQENQLQKPLLRSSLGRLEKQIARPHIVRCHRSYVVNIDHVERVTGNAQGYKLHLLGGQIVVPVSRQYNDTLVPRLKSL